MILDSRLELSTNQAVTTSTASTNVIDFGQSSPDLGMAHQKLYAVLTIPEGFVGLSSFKLSIQDSANETSGFSDVVSGETLTLADVAVGKQYVLPMPMKHKRYVRGYYTVGGNASAGKVNLNIVNGLQVNTPKPDSPRAWGGR